MIASQPRQVIFSRTCWTTFQRAAPLQRLGHVLSQLAQPPAAAGAGLRRWQHHALAGKMIRQWTAHRVAPSPCGAVPCLSFKRRDLLAAVSCGRVPPARQAEVRAGPIRTECARRIDRTGHAGVWRFGSLSFSIISVESLATRLRHCAPVTSAAMRAARSASNIVCSVVTSLGRESSVLITPMESQAAALA